MSQSVSRAFRWAVPLLVLALLVFEFGLRASHSGAKSPPSAAAPTAFGRPVPVSVAAIARRDVPLWLEGIGSAAAFQQATIRTQVDGKLERVLFREGQVVHKGDLLAEIDARPYMVQLHQAEGALARDTAQVDQTKRDLQRYQTLTASKLIAEQQVDQQRASVAQATGAAQVSAAAVESARLNLDYCSIRAPFEGVVGVRLVDPGNYVRAADSTGIVVLTQLDPAAVLFTLPQDELPQIVAAQQRGDVQVEAYSRDGQQLLGKGALAAVDNQINATTATVRLKAVMPNPKRALWPNEFVKVRILVDTLPDAWVVPSAAVQRGPQGTFLYVVDGDQKALPRPVKVRLTTGDSSVLEGQFDAGALVVIEGQNQLRPGALVHVVRPPGRDANTKTAQEVASPR